MTQPARESDASRRKSATIARNSVLMMAGFAITSAFMFFTDLAVIKAYNPVVHGQVTLALSVAILGVMLCDLGLASKAGVRTIARLRGEGSHELGDAVGHLLTTLLLVGLVAGVALHLLAPVLVSVLDVSAYALRQASIWLFAGAGVRACAMVFIGFERMIYVAALGAIAEAARLGWTVLCGLLVLDERYLYLGWSFTWVGSLLACMACVALMLGRMGIGIGWWPWHPRRAAGEVWRGLAYLPPMMTNQSLPPLLFLLVGLTLEWRGGGGAAELDRLSVLKVCFSLALVLRIVSQAMATSLFPVVARRSAGRPTLEPRLLRAFDLSVCVLGISAVGAVALFVAFGALGLGVIDRWNHTALYVTGLPALLILAVAVSADSYRVQVDQLLMGTEHVRIVIAGELTKMLLLLVMIPVGVIVVAQRPDVGAAAAVLLVLLLVAVWRGVAARRLLCGAGGRPAALGLLAVLATGAVYLTPPGAYVVMPVAAVMVAALWFVVRPARA